MAVLRAQIVHRHSSGESKDNVVNVLHFNGTADAATGLTIANVINELFTVPTAIGVALDVYLSGVIQDRVIKVYDVTEEPSGPAFYESGVLPRVATGDATNLPSEVAFCVTYEGNPGPGLVQRRRRGRTYLGPLNRAASTAGGAAAPRPHPTFMTCAREAFARMALNVDSAAEFVVYSRPYAGRAAFVDGNTGKAYPALAARPGTTVNVDRVSTDDAFDTQRRRGEKGTARTVLTTGE